MAVIAGTEGDITWATWSTNTYAWSLDIECEVVNATTYTSANDWAENVPGVKRWSGTISWRQDSITAGVAPGGAAANLTLQSDAGTTYAGSAILSGQHLTHNMEGECIAVADFVGTTTLT